MTGPIAELRGLAVAAEQSGATIIEGAYLKINTGEILGLVGESGSGKTTAALGLMGYIRPGMKRVEGAARVLGIDMFEASPAERRRALREVVSYVPQSAGFALDPSLRIERQMIKRAPGATDAERQENVRRALDAVALPDPELVALKFPHQLSGGQQQRVAIAAAFLSNPKLVVLDEPTTGLDVTTQAQVLQLLRRLCQETHAAALFISHDLGAVGELCDSVAVMSEGVIVESGSAREVLGSPNNAYTRSLIDSVPDLSGNHRFLEGGASQSRAAQVDRSVVPILEVRDVAAAYRGTTVLCDVSFQLHQGQTLGIVGESGSGKSTLSRVIAGLHTERSGEVLLDGMELAVRAKKRSAAQLQTIQYVFQNPYDSLNPRHDVASILTRPMQHFGRAVEKKFSVDELLDLVSLPRSVRHSQPGALSGGERQRLAIARAVALSPEVMLCDEVTSSLDVTVQASVLKLLKGIQHELGMAMVFVTHNMAVVRHVADDIITLKDGRVVEAGPVEAVFNTPQHAYTKTLLSNVPDLWRTIDSWSSQASQEGSGEH